MGKFTIVILIPLTVIGITLLLVSSTLILWFAVMWSRISRVTQFEYKLSQHVLPINTAQLKSHLQNISISVVEIDTEVAKLKQDIIDTAHLHQIKVNQEVTRPDSPFNTEEKRNHLIKIVEKRKQDITTRVG